MTNPTTPTPAEIARIIAEAKSQNVKDWICFCPGPACDTGHPCVSVAALIACAERGIAPPSEEVEAAVAHLRAAERLLDDCGEQGMQIGAACDLILRLYAPPVAAPSGEERELLARAADRMEEQLVCDGNECLPIGGGEDAPVKHSDDCVVVLCEEIRVFLRATLRK